MVVCFDEGVVELFDESVVTCFHMKNNKNDFDLYIRNSLDDCFEYFLPAHPLEYIFEGSTDGKFIVHHGYMNNFGWTDTYVHFSHDHKHKNPTIYQDCLDYGKKRDWSETYIHFYHNHQHFLNDRESKIVWSLVT